MASSRPVSRLEVFLKSTVHSTAGKSAYSTAAQRTWRPETGSVHVVVRRVRAASSREVSVAFGQAGSRPDEAFPP